MQKVFTMPIPIALFVYKRTDTLAQTVDSLINNPLSKETELFIFSDGWKNDGDRENVLRVREFIQSISGFARVNIVEQGHNKGLASSIIDGVTSILQTNDRVIVLEDDLVASKHYLEYMNRLLDYYAPNQEVFSVTGYAYPSRRLKIPSSYPYDVYPGYRCDSLGWGTWKDRWNKVDWDISDYQNFMKDPKAQAAFNRGGADLTNMLGLHMDGLIDSWAIRFCYAHFRNSACCIYPVRPLIKHIGFDDNATHASQGAKILYYEEIDDNFVVNHLVPKVEFSHTIMQRFRSMYAPRSLAYRILKRLSKLLAY